METINKKTAFFLLLAFSLLSFAQTLRVGFIWDDHQMIEQNPYIKSFSAANLKHNLLSNAFNQEGETYYRPLQILSYMLDFRLFKLDPAGWHVVNLFFHFLNSFLLFLLLKKLNFSPHISFLASAFFAANPMGVEQLLIIAGRAELMTFAFSLLSILFFMEEGILYYSFSLFFFVLSMLSKENGVVTPVFIMLAAVYGGRKDRFLKIVPYFVLIPFYLFLRKAAVGSAFIDITPLGFAVSLFLKMPYIFFNYIYKTILPVNLHSHNLLFHFDFLSYSALFIGIAMLKYFAFIKRGNKAYAFAFLWYAAGLLPKIPLFGSQSLVLDHWIYPSNAGLFLAFALIIEKISEKAPRASLLFPAAFISLWGTLGNYNISLRNSDLKIYENAVLYKTSDKVYYNLSREYYLRGDFRKSRETIERVIDRNRADEMFLNAYALTLWKTGDEAAALETFFSLIKKGAKTPATWLNLASLYGEKGDYDLAGQVILSGLAVFPEDENLKLYMARIYSLSGKTAAAHSLLLEIDAADPYNPEVLMNLGVMELKAGNYFLSREYLERLLTLEPGKPEVLELLKETEASKASKII